MMRWWPILASVLMLAQAATPPARLSNLVAKLPEPNHFVKMADLGITACAPSPSPGSYNFCPPLDLDVRRYDAAGMHLNLPLHVVPDPVNHLFMSDQPERVEDTLKRENGTTGATGIYATSHLPGAAPIRVLMDHTNGTKRPLHLWLVWVPDADGVLMIGRLGWAQNEDSVWAGTRSFEKTSDLPLLPRTALQKGVGVALLSTELKPEETAVVEDTFTSTVPGRLVSLVTEADAPPPLTPAVIDGYPVMHSIIWREQANRLEKYVNPKTQPRRYEHIVNQPQHSRGDFHFPDRMAYAVYDAPDWDESKTPLVQIYTIYESVPGQDQGTATENRGKYGSVVGVRWKIQRLPPGCNHMAVLALNPGNTFGGRTDVTDEVRLGVESLWVEHGTPGLMHKGDAATLWRGPIQAGQDLVLQTEPMGNISVALWYALVPIP
ncbi:MAG: hypothetical protein ACYCW6_07885 [Candidatus Xenobia bacterium]